MSNFLPVFTVTLLSGYMWVQNLESERVRNSLHEVSLRFARERER